MKRWLYMLAALLSWLPVLQAQVSVDLLLDQEDFLPQETLPLGVRITNLSGKTLQFGTNSEWLRFSVEYFEGSAVNQLNELPQQDAFTLESSKRGTRVVDLAACYDCGKAGRYRVTAILNIPGWESVIMSQPKTFNIVNGLRIWEQVFGLPPQNGAPNQYNARKYILQKVATMKESKLYVRLTDAQETRTLRIYLLTPMVSFAQPEAQIDKDGNLHVICQTGARVFMYHVLSVDCELLKRLTYEYGGSRPVLSANGEGSYRVTGGKRKVTPDDIGTAPELPVVKIVTPIDTNSIPTPKKKKKKDDNW